MLTTLEIPKTSQSQCRKAVQRAFRELRKNGVAEVPAFDSAAAVYRLHHPDISERDARFKIANWLE